MGIIEEALKVLGESADRIQKVRVAAIQKQVRCIEDTKDDWLFLEAENDDFTFAYEEFLANANHGLLRGSVVAEVIQKVTPILKQIKSTPSSAQIPVLTQEKYLEFITNSKKGKSYLDNFVRTVTRSDGSLDSKAVTRLAGFLRDFLLLLTDWAVGESGLSKETISSMQNGADNSAESTLKRVNPALYVAAKAWYKDDLTALLDGVKSENDVVDKTVDAMKTNLLQRIHNTYPAIDTVLEFTGSTDLLNTIGLEDLLIDQSMGSSAEDVARSIINYTIGPVVKERLREKFDSERAPIVPALDDDSLSALIQIPKEKNLFNGIKNTINNDQYVGVLSLPDDFASLLAQWTELADRYKEINRQAQEYLKNLTELGHQMTYLQKQIGLLPGDLKTTVLSALDTGLFGADSEDKLKGFADPLVTAVEDYYSVESNTQAATQSE